MARVQISISDDALDKIDSFAKGASLSRSSFLSMAALDYIAAKEKAPLLSSAMSSMASLLDSRVRGEISQEDFQTRLDSLDKSFKQANENK